MKKWMQFVGVPFLVAGIFGMMIGPNVNVSADEPTAASGSSVTIETPAETPLGAAVITAAKKAPSLKQVTITWTQSGEAQGAVIFRKSEKSDFAEIARISDGTPGNKMYVDKSVKAGKTYIYQVCVFRTRADGTTQMQTEAKTASVKLVPGKIKGLKAKKRGRKIVVTWKKTKSVSGYQVYTKVFVKGIKTKYSRAKTQKGRSYKRGMLVHGMKYGFMVRAYKKVNGKKIYGPFTTVKKRY